jgi:hypothetical protein
VPDHDEIENAKLKIEKSRRASAARDTRALRFFNFQFSIFNSAPESANA